MFAGMLLRRMKVWRYQAVRGAHIVFFVVFWEEKTIFGNGQVTLQDSVIGPTLFILLRLVLSICRDESWRQEVEIGESSAIIHSYLYKPPVFKGLFFTLILKLGISADNGIRSFILISLFLREIGK